MHTQIPLEGNVYVCVPVGFRLNTGQEGVVAQRKEVLAAVVMVIFDDLRTAFGDVARFLPLLLPISLLCGKGSALRVQGCHAGPRHILTPPLGSGFRCSRSGFLP